MSHAPVPDHHKDSPHNTLDKNFYRYSIGNIKGQVWAFEVVGQF